MDDKYPPQWTVAPDAAREKYCPVLDEKGEIVCLCMNTREGVNLAYQIAGLKQSRLSLMLIETQARIGLGR